MLLSWFCVLSHEPERMCGFSFDMLRRIVSPLISRIRIRKFGGRERAGQKLCSSQKLTKSHRQSLDSRRHDQSTFRSESRARSQFMLTVRSRSPDQFAGLSAAHRCLAVILSPRLRAMPGHNNETGTDRRSDRETERDIPCVLLRMRM